MSSMPWGWEAAVRELFADFQWKDWAFFRVGKHTIQWGVGYFFSPADVLNLVSIDPMDPTAEREGPISLKTHVPFGQNNAYLYVIANDITHPAEIAVAPKVEVVLGGYELGAGGFVQKDLPAGLMLTATGPLGKLDLFGEAVLQYAWQSAPQPLVFSSTFGAGYLDPEHGMTVFAQYLFAECAIAAADLPAARATVPRHAPSRGVRRVVADRRVGLRALPAVPRQPERRLGPRAAFGELAAP